MLTLERILLFPNYSLITIKDHYRFWSKVDCINKRKEECWNWLGYKDREGYGSFCLFSICYRSNRVSYFLEYKKDPKQLLVCHECNNPSCVNPNHLYLGNNSDNISQAVNDNRKPMYGEFNPKSKINDKIVLEIIRLSKSMLQREIANKYGICQQTVSNILSNKNWRHVH